MSLSRVLPSSPSDSQHLKTPVKTVTYKRDLNDRHAVLITLTLIRVCAEDKTLALGQESWGTLGHCSLICVQIGLKREFV